MKKLVVVILLLTVALVLIKKKEMSYRQSVLKVLYPLIMFPSKLFGNAKAVQKNIVNKMPIENIYSISIVLNNGSKIMLEQFRGKKILLVNTASDCGFTGQYEALEKLHKLFPNQLVVIGFPANDFKEQEKKDDVEIAEFCKINYGVTFLLAKKSKVVKGDGQNELFFWLSHAEKNGWYLIITHGVLFIFFLLNYFSVKLEDKNSVKKFYLRFWVFFFAEYILFAVWVML